MILNCCRSILDEVQYKEFYDQAANLGLETSDQMLEDLGVKKDTSLSVNASLDEKSVTLEVEIITW